VTAMPASSTVRERYVDSDYGTTHVWVGGDGPPLLLLHGAGPGVDAELNWAHVWERLARRFRCIAPDLLGFGATDRPAELPQGPAAWAEARLAQVTTLLDALEIDRAHVLGNSSGGGAVGLRMLARAPERVSRTVLMGGAGTGPSAGVPAVSFYDDPSPSTMEQTIRRLVHDPSRAPQPLAQIARRRYELATRAGAEATFRSMHAGARQAGFEAETGADAPVLLVHGAEDQACAVDVSFRLRMALGTAHLHVFPDAGHWIHVDQPDAFCTLVESFLLESW
jgi:2-hydroxymuconate-semialdehyde hydrolase